MRALTLDKLSRPSVVRDPGPEPSQGWSPVEKLVIDPEYQRHGAAPVTLALSAFKKSVYGDLPIAWGNTILFAWVQAVAGNKRACGMSAAALAAFHNDFDVLEADDVVLADIRAAKRAGEKTLAHMASLAEAIGAALADFTANLKETA